MGGHEEEKTNLDILKHVEDISRNIDRVVERTTKPVFKRYPVTFGLLTLFGVVAVSEGVKGILESLNLFIANPVYQLIFGLVILILTGSLYKRLDK